MAREVYFIDISHPGLNRFQHFKGPDKHVVQARAAAKLKQWDAQWEAKCKVAARNAERGAKTRAKEEQRAYVESRKLEAVEATAEAERAIAAVEGLLAHTLRVDDRVDFEALKSTSAFSERRPVSPAALRDRPAPVYAPRQYLAAPLPWWEQIFEMVVPSRRATRLEREDRASAEMEREDKAVHEQALAAWRQECTANVRANEDKRRQFEAEAASWSQREQRFRREQQESNDSIDELKRNYFSKDAGAIEQYIDMVLSSSSYPDSFPQKFSVRYDSSAELAVVELVLPRPEDLPSVKSVKYLQARDELVESYVAESAQKKLYDGAVYQIALRTIHELFEADLVQALKAVAFNGVVETVDPATGKDIRPCIVSVQASRAEFSDISLATADPKACFRKLKGVGSAQLHALSPIPPVIRFQTDDVRFVDGRNVIDGVNEGSNLAAMAWEDFEHLIRDMFEREFASGGAEVRITQASRDGGVDAVIFDRDPIRGGKFLVQAKRYTNTVGVSAVRDLYGAMTNERASRGILVTTSDYGHDSYEFAKDKPITLLSGSNLLSMLHKHGVQARIDLAEAKLMGMESKAPR